MCNLSNSYALANVLYCRGVVVFCSLRYPIFFGPSESAFARCAGVYIFPIYLWTASYMHCCVYVVKSLLKRIINVARWRVRTGKRVCLGRFERLINENHFTSVALIANTLVSGASLLGTNSYRGKFSSNFKEYTCMNMYLTCIRILDCYFLVQEGIMRIVLNYNKRFSYYRYYLWDGHLIYISRLQSAP